MEFIDGQQRIIKAVVRQFLHAVAQSGMSAHQHFSVMLPEELYESPFLILLVLHVCQVEVRSHLPVGKKASARQIGILERTAYALFRHSHHHLLNALMLQLVECDKHQRTTLA